MNDNIKSANFDSLVSYNSGTGLPEYDRPLKGEDVRKMYQMLISNGIYPNPSTSFQILEGVNANEVVVKAGCGWVQGCPVWDLSDETITLNPADNANPRIDLVVLQWNNQLANRWVHKEIKTGTAAANPVPPTLTRSADIYEICLAEIRRPANSSTVSQANITDTRGNQAVCGWSHGIVDQVDTTTIFNQYAAWLQDIQNQWDAWWSTQQSQSGYMTTDSSYVNLNTSNKQIIGAINEVYSGTLAPRARHTVLAGPLSGGTATPTFRALRGQDISQRLQKIGNSIELTGYTQTLCNFTLPQDRDFCMGTAMVDVTLSEPSMVRLSFYIYESDFYIPDTALHSLCITCPYCAITSPSVKVLLMKFGATGVVNNYHADMVCF